MFIKEKPMKKNFLLTTLLPAHISITGQNLLKAQTCQSQESHGITMVSAPAIQQHDIVDTAVQAGKFNTLVAAVKAAGLVDTLKSDGPLTVFAPTDEAFSKLPQGTVESLLKPENLKQLQDILTYHVVSGKVMAADVVKLNSASTVQGDNVAIKVEDGTVKINDASVIATDVACSNGVIHIVDSVLLPTDKPDIVDTAVSNGNFTTLVAAVKAAGLVDTLKGEGPFTVFAPNDEAFSKLPTASIEELLKPENRDQLAGILTYHVVSGRILAEDVVELTHTSTVNGQKAKIKASEGKVTIDNAQIVKTDIECGNGVIHVIDTVIMPQ